MDNSNNLVDNNKVIQQPNNNINGNITPPLQSETTQNNNTAFIEKQKILNQSNNNSNINNNYNTNNINSMNQIPVNNINNTNLQTINSVTNTQKPQNIDNTNQNYTSNNNSNDELLRAFIGNNYEKITTKPFNFAGFLFTTFYMFYRKMFLYGILLFITYLIIIFFVIKNSFLVSILLGIVVGFLINKVYLYYAKKKINKIKLENSQKSIEELKNICFSKGGTSTSKIFLGFLAEAGIAFVTIMIMIFIGLTSFVGDLFNIENWDITINGNKVNSTNYDANSSNSSSSQAETLLEDATIRGYSCFASKCTISIENSNGNTTDYKINDGDLFITFYDYKDYIKFNIYYTTNGNEKIISNYKIYLKSNNEDITSIKTEKELRDKIGLYSLGTHTDTFTLKEIDDTYFDTTYTFVNSKNVEYKMEYENSDDPLNLTEGNKYTVTFEVVDGIFGDELKIKSVE